MEQKYFDLITSGIGYLNRSREVKPKGGAAYESVSIAALRGNADNPSYSYFDCRVVGSDAIDFVTQYRNEINDRNHKVLVRFNVGDGEGDSYELSKGEHAGERRHLIKGRLLKITWAKIDDQVMIEADPQNETGSGQRESELNETAMTASQGEIQAAKTTWEQTIGEVVKLEKDDPYFERKQERLQALGYHWVSEDQAWRKAA